MTRSDLLIIVGFILAFTAFMVFGIHYTWQDKPIQINPIVADDVPYDRWK